MGSTYLGGLVESAREGLIEENMALRLHLSHNCYPPAGAMYEPCRMAIERCIAGEPEAMINLPNGCAYRGEPVAKARIIVENFRLWPFVNEEDESCE